MKPEMFLKFFYKKLQQHTTLPCGQVKIQIPCCPVPYNFERSKLASMFAFCLKFVITWARVDYKSDVLGLVRVRHDCAMTDRYVFSEKYHHNAGKLTHTKGLPQTIRSFSCNILYNYRMSSADGQSSFSGSTYTQVMRLCIPKYLLHSLRGGLHTTITLRLLGYPNQTCNVTAPLLRDCREVHQSALRARLETTLHCQCRLMVQGTGAPL